jgi:carbon monoxide dehydrogenase subunit G
MDFEGTVEIAAPGTVVWEHISDPEVLVNCVPGAKDVERLSETEYEGTIERSVARITMELEGNVELTELEPPSRLVANATGEDLRTGSFMDAEATLQMDEHGETTTVTYDIDLTFSGRIASLGARIVKRKIDSDIGEFFDNVQEVIQAETPDT